jgi:hypothetical protein
VENEKDLLSESAELRNGQLSQKTTLTQALGYFYLQARWKESSLDLEIIDETWWLVICSIGTA